MPNRLTAACLWNVSPDLVLALDECLGPPVDSYLNGSQTWLTDDGPGGVTLEWRLHPVAGYQTPQGLSHYDVWEGTVASLSAGQDSEALPLGEEARGLRTLWEGLECFAAYGDELEPATLARSATEALGVPPDASGLVDHEAAGDAWERSEGTASIVRILRDQLRT